MAAARERLPGEIVFACLMLLLSAFLLWTSIAISGFKSATSAGSFPMAAAAMMLVCSLIVVAQTVRLPPTETRADESLAAAFVRRIAPPTVVWTTLSVIAYMLLLERLVRYFKPNRPTAPVGIAQPATNFAANTETQHLRHRANLQRP